MRLVDQTLLVPTERETLLVSLGSHSRNDFSVLGRRGHSSPGHLVFQDCFVDHDPINWAVGRLRNEVAAPKVFQLKIEQLLGYPEAVALRTKD